MLIQAARRREDRSLALHWARRATELEPEHPSAAVWHGQCALEADEAAEAEAWFRAGTELAPGRADMWNGLGLALQSLGRHMEAVGCFERALQILPDGAAFWINLAEAQISVNEVLMSLDSARSAVKLRPDRPMGHILCAQALVADNRAGEAQEEARLACELEPSNPIAAATYSSALMAVGRMDEAAAMAKQSIALEPRQGVAYFNLARCRRLDSSDRLLIDEMLGVASAPDVPIGQRCLLAFGLGKGLEDLGEYEEAMRWYDEANRLDYRRKFGTQPFDMNLNLHVFSDVKERYSSALSEGRSSMEGPIFVFGMMRSGTTLLEQILSSHPDVGAAGEQRFWLLNRDGAHGPNSLALDGLRLDYLGLLHGIAPGKRFVVDKMPTNTMQVGLLHLAFPSAPLIHVRRNPLDTCLSIYATHNRVPIPWANRKEDIALNYERYLDLMSHWRRVLPERRMFEVQYEELVCDPEPVIRELLAYCGLPWSDDCLHHERNERAVVTPSLWQVRQPIYRTSMARWKRFEPWLGGLASLKEPVGV